MIKKVLIANRSEIACRIIKACKEMDIRTVAVYSDADKNALHVRLADESVYIGSSPAKESYLDHNKIIEAALSSGADAIHPGYGFLSENFEFNKKVRAVGLTFIGPDPEPMKLLASKIESRLTMMEANVPVIPGMKGASKDIDEYIKLANSMGYPVLIKASAGGGGKGMRVVYSPEQVQDAVESSMRESQSAFGSDEVFLEKYIEEPRHIEFQVAADKYGNAVHLFERECSIQRRHQKIIEETPSVALNQELRERMGAAAVKAIKAVNYDSVATVEFLLDKNGDFYFLEVNTRIQVEHPITEMTTGIDLVKLQISIANGDTLPFVQSDLSQRGHAIECRIYAEDADNNFMPSAGKILFLNEPKGNGIRIDSGIYQGVEVPVFYDPIMAKIIISGQTREEAHRRMILALKDYVIFGVKTSIGFMLDILESEEFVSGKTFTNFIDTNIAKLNDKKELPEAFILIAAEDKLNSSKSGVAVNSSANNISSNSLQSPWLSIGHWEIGI